MIVTAPIISTMIPQPVTTASYYNSIQHTSPSLLKSGMELSELCSTIVQALCGGGAWDIDRQMNFTLFCNRLLIQIDIPPSVVYTSLKYFQNILLKSINKQSNLIDITAAHEYSLFTVSLLLAYKFLEDSPPYMSQWSFASMISIQELKKLELIILDKLEFSLNVSTSEFYQWTEQCNAIYDMPHYNLSSPLLPVLLNVVVVPQPTISSTSSSSSVYSSSPLNDDGFCWLPSSTTNGSEEYYNPAIVDDFLFIDNNDYNTTTAIDYSSYYPTIQQDYTQCNNNWLPQQQFPMVPMMDHLWYLTQQPIFL